jgi:tetratricopeptide (TPR) repeat protein
MLQPPKEVWLIATCVFANMIASQPSLSSPIVLRKDPALMALVPTQAFEGIGSWSAGGYYIATGYSTSAESLGAEREKGIEEKLAEKDAKARISCEAALRKDPQFDEESYTCQVEISGFRIAATYKIEDRDGLFVVGVAPEDAVSVNIAFDAGSARRNALVAFNAGDYGHAARLLAGLTERGIQDPEIIALARAASAGVNFVAGITGASRMAALRVLADFYFEKGDAEEAVQFYYRLYRESNDPDRVVLERLAELCAQTHRDDSAKAFHKEVSRLWPESAKP